MAAPLTDRFDSHSISQESSSEQPAHLSLDDLSDEQILLQIEEMTRINQMLTLENQIFEKGVKKLEPFMLAANAAGASTSSLSTTPSGSQYDLNNAGGGAPPATGGRAGYRKRSKSRSTVGDYRMRLNADQKCEIASKEIDELKDDTNRAADMAERSLDGYKAVLEEADIRMNEIKIEIHEFDRDINKGAINPLNKKIITEKLFKYFEDRIKDRDTLIEKLKLKNSSMRKKKSKLMSELREKEELGEVLHEVDFKQLKIENKQYIEKIDEKNSEMINLKKMVGTVTQTLNYRKNQLSQYFKEYETILNEIKTRVSITGKLSSEQEVVEKEHAKEENKNRKLRAQLDNYKVPDITDYVSAEDCLYNLQKEVKVWERKCEIAEMALKINKQSWIQMKNQSNQQQQEQQGGRGMNNIAKSPGSYNQNNQISGSAF